MAHIETHTRSCPAMSVYLLGMQNTNFFLLLLLWKVNPPVNRSFFIPTPCRRPSLQHVVDTNSPHPENRRWASGGLTLELH